MIKSMTKREERRLAIQAELDAAKDQAERNRMGQFATPTELAVQIIEYARGQLNETEEVRFIDPAIGTGSFYSALLKVFPAGRLTRTVGYEVDPHYGEPAARLWKGTMLDVRLEDFTLAAPPIGQREVQPVGLQPALCAASPYSQQGETTPEGPHKGSLRHQGERTCRSILLLPRIVSPVDGGRRTGGLADTERIHGRQLRRVGEALSA